ncbi:MAG: LuxR family transcriptional regulator, partial [Mycobacterium sp.]|nr:LuxR family transcriptional regulator [Mycobacterium sp.]
MNGISETPSVDDLADGDHPGWASRQLTESPAARRYRETFQGSDIDPTDDPMTVVAEAVDARATVVRNALELVGDEPALNALEAVLDLASLERELIEDGARRRTFALLQVQEGLSKLRVVDDVATIVDRAPRELVESCGFDRAVLFRVHEGRMVMESA